MPNANRKLRVFLCHASQNKPVVRELYQRLLAEGWIDPWLDEEKLLPGQDWNLEIEKAVESADAVINCVSSVSVGKEGYVQREVRRVLDIALEKLEGSIYVIPMRLDDCEIPRQLRNRQFLDYFPESKRDSSYDKLKKSLIIRKDALGK
jgi:TIR domain